MSEAPKDLKDKALEVIEALVSDDFSENMTMNMLHDGDIGKEDSQLMARKLATIYRIAHSVNPHSCYEVHDDWRKEMLDLYNKLGGK